MFSIIMTYRESSSKRRRNLDFVTSYFGQHLNEDFEVIVVEQDSSSKLGNDYYRKLFVYNSGLFNRGWGLNVGARICNGDILVFSDCDILIPFNDLKYAVEISKKFEAVDPKGTLYQVEDNVPDPFLYRGNKRAYLNFAGGMMLMQRSKFFEIGGWPEEFMGWGCEDNVMCLKIAEFTNSTSVDLTLFHLYHESADTGEGYKRNLKILKDIEEKKRTGRLGELCHQEIGEPYKFRDL